MEGSSRGSLGYSGRNFSFSSGKNSQIKEKGRKKKEDISKEINMICNDLQFREHLCTRQKDKNKKEIVCKIQSQES